MRLTEGFTAPLCDVLRIPRGLTALVGGGGKSSLMERLARELAPRGRVLVGTTTHIFPPPGMPLLLEPDAAAVEAAFSAHPGETLCVGAREAATGKLTACGLSAARLLELADYVLLEADGAKRLPLKAPAPHEPVIPPETALVVALAGLDGIGRPLREAVFRYERYAALLGRSADDPVTPEDAARVLVSEAGQRKGVLPGMRFALVLNKADDPARAALAARVAAAVPEGAAETVVCISLRKGSEV